MQKLVLLISIVCLIGCNQLSAQINNTLLENHIEIADSNTGDISLSVESRNFLKNNEYFGNIATGYTLMGTQLATQLAYQANDHMRIQGGVNFRSDFGNNHLQKISPIITLKLQKNGYSFLFGTLEGNLSHRLIEPLYNYERYISNNVENGLQIKVDKEKIWSDTWVNWEVMQYLISNYQEQFSAGHSSIIKLVNTEKIHFYIPLQGLVTHRGGQIDTINVPLETIANLAIGFSFSYKPNAWIKEIRTDNYYTIYKDLSPTKLNTFDNGNGYYTNITAVSKHDISASVGYWNGVGYRSNRGGYLFQSEASIYGTKGYTQANRNIIFFRALYQKQIMKGLSADVRFEPYYDLGNSLFEYSYSIYLTYKKDFRLINIMKRK